MIKMRVPYIYIPPCPRCGSKVTGRYVKQPAMKPDYMMLSSLKNGEIIVFRDPEPINNGFCLDCGAEWPQKVRTTMITKEERTQQIVDRGTEEMYEAYIDSRGIPRQHSHSWLKGAFGGLFDL